MLLQSEVGSWNELLHYRYGHEMSSKMYHFRKLVWRAAGYKPTPSQYEVIRAPRWTKLISGGVRAGKSMTTAMMLADFLVMPGELVWIVGGSYEAARQEFQYLHEALWRLGLLDRAGVSMPKVGPWSMEVRGGANVVTRSSSDIKTLASVAPIAQAYVEAAAQDAEIFDKAMERGLQKDGLIVFSGTLEAQAQMEFTNLFVKWQHPKVGNPSEPQSFSLPTWSNTFEFPGGRKDPKFLRMIAGMTEDKFNERVAAIPYRPQGLVHKNFNPNRQVVPLAHDPEVPVHVAIDPGYRSYVVLFVQMFGEYVHVLDEVYRHEALTHDIVGEVMSHPLWEFVTWGIIDKAARQHHAGESVWEVWRRLTGIPLITRSVSVQDGIDAIESRCMDGEDGSPRLLINRELQFRVGRDGRSSSLLGEFNLRRWPRFKATRSDGVRPIKANDHALNALGYYLFHWYRQEPTERVRPSMVGQVMDHPARLAKYIPKRIARTRPDYGGNKARAQILPRRKRRMAWR